MKTCPECGELLGDSVETCFNCSYNFNLKRKLTKNEIEEKKKKSEQEKHKLELENNKLEEERRKQLVAERLKENERITKLSKNPIFEYQTVIINNLKTGAINQIEFQKTLETWSQKGWRLHSVFNNELGKTVSPTILGPDLNATIDQTVLIFERCIKAESN